MSEIEHAPPFGLLFCAACIRRYRKNVFEDYWQPGTYEKNIEIRPNLNNSYLSHMGFWRSIGHPLGKEPGEAFGSSRYLPISQLNQNDLMRAAATKSLEIGDAICNEADRLAEVLTQEIGQEVETTISYSLRELFRNVFEHGQTQTMWYCAQFWPSRDTVEIAVLDEGCGIRASLVRNPVHNPGSEERAIILATERGVSGSVPRPTLRSISGEVSESRWVNSGWGLFVLRRLAEEAGSLLIASNEVAVSFSQSGIRSFRLNHSGVAIRLILKPSLLDNLLRRILDMSIANDPPSRLTPSMLARIKNSGG